MASFIYALFCPPKPNLLLCPPNQQWQKAPRSIIELPKSDIYHVLQTVLPGNTLKTLKLKGCWSASKECVVKESETYFPLWLEDERILGDEKARLGGGGKSVTGARRICERMRSAVIRHTCPLCTLYTVLTCPLCISYTVLIYLLCTLYSHTLIYVLCLLCLFYELGCWSWWPNH